MRNLHIGLKTPHLSLLLLATFSINMLGLALPILMMQIYNRILPNEASETLLILSSGVAVAATLDFLLKMARHRVLSHNATNFEINTARLLSSRLLKAEPGSYTHYSRVRMAQDIQAASRLKEAYTGMMITTLLLDLPFMLIMIGMIAWLAGPLVLIPLATLFCYGTWFFFQGHTLFQVAEDAERSDDRRYDFIMSALSAVHTIKANCLEAITARRFEALQAQMATSSYSAPYLHGRIDIINASLAQIMTIALISIGAVSVIEQNTAIGTLIAAILIAGQTVQPFQRAMTLWLQRHDLMIAERRIDRILSLPQRKLDKAAVVDLAAAPLLINNVSYAYQGSKPLFEEISLKVAPGTVIAIQGATGQGKTTLLELMAGLRHPMQGSITYGEYELCTLPETERAKLIAYLPMRGLIMRGSIMDNLTGFDSRLQSKARELCGMLGIDASVALLPQGYDTALEGMNTDVVSPGLCQRISIARALIHRPQVILFDNADHGLDKESYMQIFSLLAKLRGKITLILASEDRNITSLADQEWAVDNGTLIPLAGEHDELIAGGTQS